MFVFEFIGAVHTYSNLFLALSAQLMIISSYRRRRRRTLLFANPSLLCGGGWVFGWLHMHMLIFIQNSKNTHTHALLTIILMAQMTVESMENIRNPHTSNISTAPSHIERLV